MKCKCGSQKLKAYNYENLDYIFYLVDSKWMNSNPHLQHYYHTTRKPFNVSCLDCQEIWTAEILTPQYSPAINHKEIVLDLDHTLFHVEYGEEIPNSNLIFKDPENKHSYYVFARPHLKELIKALESRFDKINFFTAAVDWYAQNLINHLEISPGKLGYIKTRKDTYEARPLSFDRELMKPMENSLVVDDKHLVIDGYNNVVLKIPPYFLDQKSDQELLKIIKLLNKDENQLTPPDKVRGEISFMLKDYGIEFKDLPYEKLTQILMVPGLTQNMLNKLPIRTTYYKPYMTYGNNFVRISFADISFENYKKIWKLVKDYTKTPVLAQTKFNNLIKVRAKSFRNDF